MMYSFFKGKKCDDESKKTLPSIKTEESVFLPKFKNEGGPIMLEHLKPEEIVRMPLHLQILYYIEKWGLLAQSANLMKKAG